VSEVVERPNVPFDARLLERGLVEWLELVTPVRAARLEVAEDTLVGALEGRAAEVSAELLDEGWSESNGAKALLGLRLAHSEHAVHKVDVAPAKLLHLAVADTG
jgi:hypothetical protein